jgi:hypothetical protein
MYKKGEYFGFSAAFVEVVILNYLENCTHFKWIARDQDGCLCIYEDKPHREKTDDNIGYVYWNRSGIKSDIDFLGPFEKLFKFIKWEDSEPTSIEDVLGNCEVIEDDL